MSDSPSVRLSVRAVLVEDKKILLSRYETDGKVWFVTPGGGLHHNEMVSEGVEREVLEETGYTVRSEYLVGMREVISDRMQTANLDPGFHQVELFCRVKRLLEPQKTAHDTDRDQDGYVWMPIDELDQHTVYPDNLLEIIKRSKKIHEIGDRRAHTIWDEMEKWFHILT